MKMKTDMVGLKDQVRCGIAQREEDEGARRGAPYLFLTFVGVKGAECVRENARGGNGTFTLLHRRQAHGGVRRDARMCVTCSSAFEDFTNARLVDPFTPVRVENEARKGRYTKLGENLRIMSRICLLIQAPHHRYYPIRLTRPKP